MAVRFDASGDRVTWTGTAPTPSSGITITCWVYVSVNRSDFSTMIRLHGSGGATTVINVAMDSGGLLPCLFTAGGTSNGPQSTTVGTWARIATTVTGTASNVYVALGAAGATQSQVGTVGSNAAVSPVSGYTLGGRSPVDPDEWLNGRLAHVRLWSTVLTQSEIEAEWASASPMRTSLLFADYPLSDAGDLLDHSGNSRHLTAGSTSVTTEDGPPISTAVTGTVAAALPPLTAGMAGSVSTTGPLTVTLPSPTVDAAGSATLAGQLVAALPALETTSAATVTTSGALAGDLPAVALAASGGLSTGGQLAATLPIPTGSLAGDVATGGELTAVLPGLSAALSGSALVPVGGVIDLTLPALTMASGRSDWPPAVEDAPLPALVDVSGPYDVPWITVS
jgi:hypothetical protein